MNGVAEDASSQLPAKLWQQLAARLPAPRETLFLRACLHDGECARMAWVNWQDQATRDGTPPRRALAPVRAFLGLLYWNLERNGIDLDSRLETHLRSARLTEELRWKAYRGICASAFRALDAGAIPFLVLKGAAFAELIYPEPPLRHAADIDVLLQADDLERAAAAFIQLGWRQSSPPILPSPMHAPPIVHVSGASIELHRRLQIPYYTIPYDRWWARSQIACIAGEEVRILSIADNLLHVCAHGMSAYRMLRWIPDAWFIVRRNPDLDWAEFLSNAVSARLALPVYVALRYLTQQIGVSIPPEVIEKIGLAASRTGLRDRQAARLWAPDAWAAPQSWPQRLAALCECVFPPPVQFALHYDVRPAALPFYYLYRLARYARAKARQVTGVGG